MGPNMESTLRSDLQLLLNAAAQMSTDPTMDGARMGVLQAAENVSDAITKLPKAPAAPPAGSQ